MNGIALKRDSIKNDVVKEVRFGYTMGLRLIDFASNAPHHPKLYERFAGIPRRSTPALVTKPNELRIHDRNLSFAVSSFTRIHGRNDDLEFYGNASVA